MKEYTTPTISLLAFDAEDILTVSMMNGGIDGLGLTGLYEEFEAF